MIMKNFSNGEVYDIGQTVNGVSRFIYVEGKWHYFEERMFGEFEFNQNDLTIIIRNVDGLFDINYLGNIFSKI